MKISFCVPTYNKEHYLAEAIESVLSQTYKDCEVIIYDDRSKDSTEYLCKFYTKEYKNIHYYRNDFNVGVGMTRNMAWDKATGDVICVMDADDLSPEWRAEITVEFFKKNKDISILYGSCGLIDGRGYHKNTINAQDFAVHRLKKENYILHPTVAYRRDIKPRYRPVRYIDDWYFYLDCVLENLKFGKVDDIMGFYRPLIDGLTLSEGWLNKRKKEQRAELIEEFKDLDDDLSEFLNDKKGVQYPRVLAIYKNVKKGSSVLDVGCNGGAIIEHLRDHKECKVKGIEIAPNLVKACERKNLDVHIDDARYYDSKEQYDVIILADILEHYEKSDVRYILDNLKKNLKDDGYYLITLPYKHGAYSKDHIPDHVCDYMVDDLRQIYSDLRYEDEQIYLPDYAIPIWSLIRGYKCV